MNAAGQVVFSSLSIAVQATGEELLVSATGATFITSNPFNIT